LLEKFFCKNTYDSATLGRESSLKGKDEYVRPPCNT
jgi:hypothetical protein